MKTIKGNIPRKSGWLMTLAIAAATSGFVFAVGPPGSFSKSEFKKENVEIRKDIKAVTADQEKVDATQAKLEKDRSYSDRLGIIYDRHDLKKERADLRHEKALLRADKQELRSEHNYAVCQAQKQVCTQKKELSQAKAELRKDLRKGNQDELHGDIYAIERQQKEVNTAQAFLDTKLEARETELAAVNEDLDNAGIRNEMMVFEKKADKKANAELTAKTETTAQVKTKAKVKDAEPTASIDEGRLYPRWMK